MAVPALKLPLLTVVIPEPCCAPGRCRFRLPLMRAWLYAARQAAILKEPLAEVIRDTIRNSRDEDPWIRGGRADPDACRDIALSLIRARDVGGIQLVSTNAERLARYLCPFAVVDAVDG